MLGRFRYPLAYGWIQFSFAPLTASNDAVVDGDQAIREGIFKTGVFPTLLTFQKPVTLVGFRESSVDPIIGKSGITELQYLFVLNGKSLDSHVHCVLWGFVQLVENNHVRERFDSLPWKTSAKIY